jgi:hypothetical protein
MHYAFDHAAPCCPSCGVAMRLVRSIPKIGGLPELESFECRACRVSITEATAPAPEMDSVLISPVGSSTAPQNVFPGNGD